MKKTFVVINKDSHIYDIIFTLKEELVNFFYKEYFSFCRTKIPGLCCKFFGFVFCCFVF